jgi:hypothetical protein
VIPNVQRVAAVAALVCAVLFTPACSLLNPPVAEPDLTPAVAIVRLMPDRAWTDTGLSVRKGERLFMTTTGEVRWAGKGATSGPDGIDGLAGWRVGPGGLVGRVGDTARPFAVGGRATDFPDQHPRPPHPRHPPPAIKMPRDGTLFLGFRDFAAGDNQGSFEVTIRRARS